MIARGVTPEQAAQMCGEAIAKGLSVTAVADPQGGTFTVCANVGADIDPAKPLSDRGEFLRRWHSGETGQ